MANAELVERFQRMAQALGLLGADSFRASAFARAGRTLRDRPEEVEVLLRDVRQDSEAALARLSALSGVGTGMARRILEYVETGEIREYRELMARVPEGLFDLLEVPGLGPKAVKLLWEEMGITGVDELKARLDSPELRALPRMGDKTIENLKKALEFSAATQERVPLGIAHVIARDLVRGLEEVSGVERIDVAGSLRRGCETIGDVDLLVAASDPDPVRRRFTTWPDATQVLAQGETKCSVRIKVKGFALQADLRIVPRESYGAALLYFTGSKEHNVRLRERAIRRQMHLNEYGLFPGTGDRPQEAGTKPLAAATEEEIYDALGLVWVPPELREDRGELEPRSSPWGLIEERHIGSELHSHTRASDGRLTIEEMARLARERGLHTLAITDHSQSAVIANGLDPDRLRRHIEAIREADQAVDGITLLAGSEVDILPDGRLDYDDDLLAQLDIVVASPHAALRQDPETATRRLLAAIRHPLVHILGHPTGRVVGRRPGLSPDMQALFEAACEHDTALEINANWRRLDLRDVHVRGALAHGCRLAINTDAHSAKDFDHLPYGVLTARRGGLEPASCVNTFSPRELGAWLRSKR